MKPGNILVTADGQAKVSDLGLAGFLGGEDDPRKYKIVGTADYISPEQIKSPESVTPSSDIYSLGCTLYYTVTGKVPFPGGTTRTKARRHCEETPWHPRRFNPEISDDFVDIIADMMEKNPERRIKSATEVVHRLEPWCNEPALLPTQHSSRSPWMPPPLPTQAEEEDEELQATQDGSYDSFENDNQTSGGVLSQATEANASQDTKSGNGRKRRFPSLPFGPPTDAPPRGTYLPAVLIALAIAIPVSMWIGFLLGQSW